MNPSESAEPWKEKALAEIDSIKEYYQKKHKWQIQVIQQESAIILLVLMRHKSHPERVKMLKLAYGPEFPYTRPREGFVNPENTGQEGIEWWIDDSEGAFKRTHNPPVICLEGTWGFHSVLHRDRDPLRANINKLLVEVQTCFDRTP